MLPAYVSLPFRDVAFSHLRLQDRLPEPVSEEMYTHTQNMLSQHMALIKMMDGFGFSHKIHLNNSSYLQHLKGIVIPVIGDRLTRFIQF